MVHVFQFVYQLTEETLVPACSPAYDPTLLTCSVAVKDLLFQSALKT